MNTIAQAQRASVVADIKMFSQRIRALLRDLEGLDLSESIERSTQVLDGIEAERFEISDGLAHTLRSLSERLLVYTESLGLLGTRARVLEWRKQWPASDLGTTKHWATTQGDGRESLPYSEIEPILDALYVLLGSGEPAPDPVERRDRDRLDYCLRSLAKLCHDHGVLPTNEHDVQRVLHNHLSSVFPDYSRTVTISKPGLSFKPDGGVPSLKSAIECKFVATPREVAKALHGLTEDLSGYSGSEDWKHFYSVVYMTGPFAVEGQFSRALEMSGHAKNWTTILVTGPGARS